MADTHRMDNLRKICLVVEYDGSSFHGWQRQSNALSVQQILEEAVTRITREKVAVVGSGRTDAGVHALAQVACFFTRSDLPAELFARAMNGLLPPEVRVLSSSDVSRDFHPQYQATGKIYMYVILNRRYSSGLLVNRCWHISQKLQVGEMRKAASYLSGRHDFSSFRSSSCTARTSIRILQPVEIVEKNHLLEIWFEGNGFLKNMVRNIVGTLADVGRGVYRAESIKEIMDARDRRTAGRCAPPGGLYLVRVKY